MCIPTSSRSSGTAAPTLVLSLVSVGGATQSVELPKAAQLNGSVADDGLPLVPGSASASWIAVGGPGSVTFGNAAQAVTDATLSVPGTYVLRLTGSDSLLTAFRPHDGHGDCARFPVYG